MYFLHAFRHFHEHSQIKFNAYDRVHAFSSFLRIYLHKIKEKFLLIYAFSFIKNIKWKRFTNCILIFS